MALRDLFETMRGVAPQMDPYTGLPMRGDSQGIINTTPHTPEDIARAKAYMEQMQANYKAPDYGWTEDTSRMPEVIQEMPLPQLIAAGTSPEDMRRYGYVPTGSGTGGDAYGESRPDPRYFTGGGPVATVPGLPQLGSGVDGDPWGRAGLPQVGSGANGDPYGESRPDPRYFTGGGEAVPPTPGLPQMGSGTGGDVWGQKVAQPQATPLPPNVNWVPGKGWVQVPGQNAQAAAGPTPTAPAWGTKTAQAPPYYMTPHNPISTGKLGAPVGAATSPFPPSGPGYNVPGAPWPPEGDAQSPAAPSQQRMPRLPSWFRPRSRGLIG